MSIISRFWKVLFAEKEKQDFSRMGVILKCLAFICITICVGLPIISNLNFAMIFMAVLVLVYGSVKYSTKNIIAIIVIAISVVSIKNVLPHVALEEGHNILVINRDGEVLERGLPRDVFVYMKKLFLKKYPLNERREPTDEIGWTNQSVPSSVFTFSADSVFQKAKYSRVVNHIDFDNLVEFRGGFANDGRYNWYGKDDIERETMPYFVMYELTEASVGSIMWWRGHVLWENDHGDFVPIFHSQINSRTIVNGDIGKRVFGISIDNKRPLDFLDTLKLTVTKWKKSFGDGKYEENQGYEEQLAIRLQLSPRLKIFAVVEHLLTLFSVIGIICLVVKINWRTLALPVLFITLAAILVVFFSQHLFGGYFIHPGGCDGTTHQTLGRNILQYAIDGDWKMALQGGESVYYNTPGFRYFRAIEKTVFGDTNYGNLIFALLFPYLMYGFLTCFVSKMWAFYTAVAFIASSFIHHVILYSTKSMAFLFVSWKLGFSYRDYVFVTEGGWPEMVCYASFLTAIWIAFKHYRIQGESYLWYGFVAHFLLFITAFMRPNISIASGVAVLYLAVMLLKEKRYKDILITWVGFAPVVLIPLHNIWFGKQFYIFTSSTNLHIISPSVYLLALKEIMTLSFSGNNLESAIGHIVQMIAVWYRLLLLLPVFYTAFKRKDISNDLRALAFCVLIGLHGANLFTDAIRFRYVFMTWMLTIIVDIALVWSLLNSRRTRTCQ